jgi:hypothetical protein
MSNLINKTIPVTSLVSAARELVKPTNGQTLLEREYDLLARRSRRGDKRLSLKIEFLDGDVINPELSDEESVTIVSSYHDAKSGEHLVTMQHSTTGTRYVR